ncbi:MAG: imidazoleglycerol-phosphate dehydratase HisB [Pseudomonadota bacterium]
MQRTSTRERLTKETRITATINLDGSGKADIRTGIGFLDHMLTLFAVHGFFDLSLDAVGDLDVDAHHTVEDVALVLGEAIDTALGDRAGICRYGHAVIPMDDALAEVTIDLSRRPFLAYQLPTVPASGSVFDAGLAKEFFRALAFKGGMNLHIRVPYGENEHHVIEAVFKALARALDRAVAMDPRIRGIHSSKGAL